jgi:CheY-like chemotaxis protein
MGGGRILVVDDDSDVRVFLTRLLQRAGYTVLTARDATQALAQADQEPPDLILTDITMPGGGFGVLDRLRTSAKAGSIPIVVLTGNDDPQVEARALAAGVSRVLSKPCDNAVLLECIETALDERG